MKHIPLQDAGFSDFAYDVRSKQVLSSKQGHAIYAQNQCDSSIRVHQIQSPDQPVAENNAQNPAEGQVQQPVQKISRKKLQLRFSLKRSS